MAFTRRIGEKVPEYATSAVAVNTPEFPAVSRSVKVTDPPAEDVTVTDADSLTVTS